MSNLRERFGEDFTIWTSSAHLDSSVVSDFEVSWYRRVRIYRFASNRVFIQFGELKNAIKCQNLVIDLNPRSITAWMLLGIRRILSNRTVVWGHLYPRNGEKSKTNFARSAMRKWADGTVVYTYESLERAKRDLPNSKAWVAPNSLYQRSLITSSTRNSNNRTSIIYVGRFTKEKRILEFLELFSEYCKTNTVVNLNLVGGGQEGAEMIARVNELDIGDRVFFKGWIQDEELLKELYSSAFAAISPGFAGLSLTQAAGFGVPTLVSKNELHSPEIELEKHGAVKWFEYSDPEMLFDEIDDLFEQRTALPDAELIRFIASNYTAENMAEGLYQALTDR